jgi:hypothetical protein
MTATGIILVTLSVALTFVFGVAVAALARVRDFAGATVATLVAGSAQIVVFGEILSLFNAWKPALVLLLQVISAPAAVLAARRWGDLSGPVSALQNGWRSARAARPRDLRRHPLTNILVAFVGAMLLLELVLAVGIAPNTWDSMTYHLTRAAYWIQHGSVAQFGGATDRQAAFPINGELLQGWLMMFSHGDRLVQLVQWVAQLGVVAFVVAAARDLRFSTREGLWAAAAVVAMPAFVAQASSSQNDLILSFFAAATLLFAMRSLTGDRGSMVIAALAAGMLIGTKSNGMLIIAAIGLALVVANGRDWRRLVRPAVYAAIGIALLGTFNYAQNIVDRGGLIATPHVGKPSVESPREWPNNAVLVSWTTAMNFPGANYGAIEDMIQRGSTRFIERPAAKLSDVPPTSLVTGSSLTEDVVGLGLPLLLLLLPSLALALIDRRDRQRFAYAVGSIAGFAAICLTLRFNPWIGRFAMAPAVLGAPLIAAMTRREGLRMLTLIVVTLSMFTIAVRGTNKPLGAGSWSDSPRSSRVAQLTIVKVNEAAPIAKVNALVPEKARLGFVGFENSWEYPYFGSHLRRKLIKLSLYDVKPGAFKKHRLDAIFVSTNSAKSKPPAGMSPAYSDHSDLYQESHFLILAPKNLRSKTFPAKTSGTK